MSGDSNSNSVSVMREIRTIGTLVSKKLVHTDW